VPDDLFGYVLHPVDLAINKLMAAAGRREVRDVIDLVTIDETISRLAPWSGRRWKNRLGSRPRG
jgi:hypothetical protein